MPQLVPASAAPNFLSLDNAWEDYTRLPNVTGNTFTLYTVPGHTYAVVVNIQFELAAGNVPGSRMVSIQLADSDGNPIYIAPAAASQPANTSASYLFSPSYSAGTSLGSVQASPLPEMLIPSTYKLILSTPGGDAGVDVYSHIGLYIRHYWTGSVSDTVNTSVATPILA